MIPNDSSMSEDIDQFKEKKKKHDLLNYRLMLWHRKDLYIATEKSIILFEFFGGALLIISLS